MNERDHIRKIFESCEHGDDASVPSPVRLIEAGPSQELPIQIQAKVIMTGALLESSFKEKATDEPTEAKSFTLNLDWESISEQLNKAVREVVEGHAGCSIYAQGGGNYYLESCFVNEEFNRRS